MRSLQMAQVTGRGKVRAVGADVSGYVAGRRKIWCLTEPDYSTTFPQPTCLEDADTCFTNQPILCLLYDYFVPSCNVLSLCHCYWEDTRN